MTLQRSEQHLVHTQQSTKVSVIAWVPILLWLNCGCCWIVVVVLLFLLDSSGRASTAAATTTATAAVVGW